MVLVQATQIGKVYTDEWVLQNIHCEIKQGERIGLVGRNGSGKSTLFRLLAGKETPSTGSIYHRKGLQIGYVEQEFQDTGDRSADAVIDLAFSEVKRVEQRMREIEERMSHERTSEQETASILQEYDTTVKEFERLDGYTLAARKRKTCQGLGITENMLHSSFKTLSGGERTKIMLAKSLLEQPALLLLDEPTNHLDLSSIEWLEGFLKTYPGSVLLISHDRYVLDRVVTKIWDIDGGSLIGYPGNYSSYIQEKESQLLNQFDQYKEQQKKIKKMEEAIRRLRQWAQQGDNQAFYRKAKNMEKALQRIETIDKPILEPKKMGLRLETDKRSGVEVVQLQNVCKGYSSLPLLHQVNLQIRFQERIAIVGKNGSGKSTLLRLILGKEKPDQGQIHIGSNVQVGYLSQYGMEETDQQQTVLEAFRDQIPVDEGTARHQLAQFLFFGQDVYKRIQDLSGGEKMRLRFAQLMQQRVNLLILDEPTNHLDIDSREVLEEALQQFQGTLLAVSHDRYFLNQGFERVYWLENQQLHLYLGNYDEARTKREERLEKKQPLLSTGNPSRKRTIPRKEREYYPRRIEKVEKQIGLLEDKILQIEERMYDPIEQQVERLQEHLAEKQRLEAERDHLYEKLDLLLEKQEEENSVK